MKKVLTATAVTAALLIGVSYAQQDPQQREQQERQRREMQERQTRQQQQQGGQEHQIAGKQRVNLQELRPHLERHPDGLEQAIRQAEQTASGQAVWAETKLMSQQELQKLQQQAERTGQAAGRQQGGQEKVLAFTVGCASQDNQMVIVTVTPDDNQIYKQGGQQRGQQPGQSGRNERDRP